MKFKSIVQPLYLKDNLYMHIKRIPNSHVFGNAPVEYNPDDNWWIFRIMRFSVQGSITSKNMLEPYKFKDIKNKKEGKNIFLKYYIPFTNQQTAMNLINYIQTDFCRGYLYLIQTSVELGRVYLILILIMKYLVKLLQKQMIIYLLNIIYQMK